MRSGPRRGRLCRARPHGAGIAEVQEHRLIVASVEVACAALKDGIDVLAQRAERRGVRLFGERHDEQVGAQVDDIL
jgi:hypothetical protein